MVEGEPTRVRWIVAGLVLLTVIVYLPGLAGDFVWDDHELISGNRYVRDPDLLGEALTHDFWHTSSTVERSEGRHSFYRPVVTLAYVAQFQAFGEWPAGYHLVSLALHLACVLLGFSWLRRRLGGGSAATVAAAAGAVLLAVHPTRVESVSWISGSTDLWLTLFVLLGLHAWSRVRGAAGVLLASIAFVLATLSKESGVVAPLVLVAEAFLLSADGAERRARLRRAAVPVLAVVATTVLRLVFVPTQLMSHEQGIWDSVRRVASSLGLYIGRILWPWPPTVQTGYQTVDGSGSTAYVPWTVVLGFLVAAGLLAAAWRAWRRPGWREPLADAAWFLFPLVPVLNLVALNFHTLVAARYLYLPLLGVAALVARLVRRIATAERSIRLAGTIGFSLAAVAGCAVGLYQQASLRNDDALWTYEHAVAPDNFYASQVLASVRLEQGRHAEALDLVGGAMMRCPQQPVAQAELVMLAAEIVLAATPDADQETLSAVRRFFDDAAVGRRGRLAAAGLEMELASAPALREVFLTDVENFQIPRAIAHARTLDLEGAERLLRATLEVEPRAVSAWANLALVLSRQGRWDDALAAVAGGLRAKPDGDFLPRLREQIAAARERERAVAGQDPVTRELVRAETVIGFGSPGLARTILDPLIELRPNDPRPVLLRLQADVVDGRFDLAREGIEAARRRAPEHARLWDQVWEKLAAEEMRRAMVE